MSPLRRAMLSKPLQRQLSTSSRVSPARFTAQRLSAALSSRPSTLSQQQQRNFGGLIRRRSASPVWDPFTEMERQLDSMVPRIFSDMRLSPRWNGPFADGLLVDLTENDTSYIIKADIPGVNKEEISITLKEDVLSISGERTSEQKDEQRHIVERSHGQFSRSIKLPTDADAESISAAVENGVLKVTVGKKPAPLEETPKKIPIA